MTDRVKTNFKNIYQLSSTNEPKVCNDDRSASSHRLSSSDPLADTIWSRHQSWTSLTAEATLTARALGGVKVASGWPEPLLDQLDDAPPLKLGNGKTPC